MMEIDHALIVAALLNIAPGAAWRLSGDTVSGLEWDPNSPVAQPTSEALNAEITRLQSLGAPVPKEVTSMQAKVALSRANLLPSVQTWVNTQSAEDQLIWSSATSFSRNSALITQAATALGLDSSAVDKLFVLASTINP